MMRSTVTGLAYGLAVAVLSAWPISKLVTLLITSGVDPVPARLIQQALLWTLGWTGGYLLLRLHRVERTGAFVAATTPALFDLMIALAFGMLPVVMGSWLDRGLAAIAATVIWLSFSSAKR
ncbi:MAG: hypothetical protein AAFX94_12895 [Myxococcota bacterium]